MSNYFPLVKTLFKSSFGSIGYQSKSGKTMYLIYGLLLLCFVPTLYMLYELFESFFTMFQPLQQEGMIFGVGFTIISLIIFVFSMFITPSIYYFSSDVETLLALPLTPQTIIGAKFSVSLLYEYVVSIAIFIPLFIAYAQVEAITIGLILIALITMITLPIYPLLLTSALTMLMMRFAPFMKNRDRFNYISSILLIAFALGFSYVSGQVGELDQQQLLLLLQGGNNSMLSLFSYFFPCIPLLSKAFVNLDFLSLGFHLVITIVGIFIFMLLAKAVYFKGALGTSESSTSKKKRRIDSTKDVRQQGIVLSYVLKEYRLLIRTPIYFINNIIMVFVPCIMVIVVALTGDVSSLSDMITPEMIHYVLSHPDMPYYLLIAGFILGMFVSNLNLTACTSISREGQNYIFMKYIPTPLKIQIHAKMLSGFFLSLLSFILMLIPVVIFLQIPLWTCGIIIISATIGALLGNIMGILVDVIHPKLVWEQEATPVKQNFTAMFVMFASIGIGVLSALPLIYLHVNLIYYSIGLIIAALLLCILYFLKVDTFLTRQFDKL